MLEFDVAGGFSDLPIVARGEVRAGSILALTGRSGSGKTTLLRMIAGLHSPTAGRVSVGGTPWFDFDERICRPIEDRDVGVVFQDHALFPRMSALHNVTFGIDAVPRKRRNARALELLERVGLGRLAGHRPADLSGGERQRLALARALASEPTALLLDEPFAALDPETAAAARQLVADEIRRLNIPCVTITHDTRDIDGLADRVAVIESGRLLDRSGSGDAVGPHHGEGRPLP